MKLTTFIDRYKIVIFYGINREDLYNFRMDILIEMIEKKFMFSGEYILKKTSSKSGASLYVILPKNQLTNNDLKAGDSIILEAYKYVNE